MNPIESERLAKAAGAEVRDYFRGMPPPLPPEERSFHDGRYVVYRLWSDGKYQGVIFFENLLDILAGASMSTLVSAVPAQGRLNVSILVPNGIRMPHHLTYSRVEGGMTFKEFVATNQGRPLDDRANPVRGYIINPS